MAFHAHSVLIKIATGAIMIMIFREMIFREMILMDKTFVLHWLDGTTERVSGPSIGTAFALAGYGGGAIGALDYYEEVDDKSLE